MLGSSIIITGEGIKQSQLAILPTLTFSVESVAVDTSMDALSFATAPSSAPFEVAYEGTFSKLEVHPGIHGEREVRFTLIGGLLNLESACDEINEAMKGAKNYPKAGFKVYLSGNEYPDLSQSEDIVITFTPVVKESGNRTRLGADPETSHTAFLADLTLNFVPNDIFRLACGAFRVKEGFPEKSEQIGTVEDKGDLAEGKAVRTEKGSRSGAVTSYRNGVRAGGWDDVNANGLLVVAGASPRN